MGKYRIHGMFGPTVFAYGTLGQAMQELLRMKQSNGGLYRIIQDGSDRVLMSLDTYATTDTLNAEANREMFARKDRAKADATH